VTGERGDPRSDLERALGALDRRAFLRGLGAAAALGVLPSGCADVPAALRPPPDLVLHTLTPRSYAVLRAASRSIVGPRGAALIDAGGVDPARDADAFLAASPALAAPLGPALLALEFGAWPFLAKLRPFTALGDPARDAILAECMHSRLALKRQLFGGVRAVALLAFYSAPGARALARLPGAPGVPSVSIEEAMRYPATD
jgi:hypothetical protein